MLPEAGAPELKGCSLDGFRSAELQFPESGAHLTESSPPLRASRK